MPPTSPLPIFRFPMQPGAQVHQFGFQHGLGVFFFLFLVLCVVVAACLIVTLLTRRFSPSTLVRRAGPTPESADPGALHILQERFARGEIDAEDFKSRRDLLVSSDH